jgi:hypothetical protein
MSFKVIYFGNDLNYWKKIREKYIETYSHLSPTFYDERVDISFNARRAFVRVYREEPQVIYLDYSVNERQMVYFSKLLNRNNVTRLVSTVALHDYPKGWQPVQKAMLAGVRINHFKSSELHDVIYDPIAFLDVELAIKPDFASGKYFPDSELYQDLRVGYITYDHLHVETNSPLKVEQIIEIEEHFLEHMMPSRRFIVENESTSDLYYNSRYAYDLVFTHKDEDFFRATEGSLMLWREYKDNTLAYEGDFTIIEEEIQDRFNKATDVIQQLEEWVDENSCSIAPKKLKILVVDDSLEIFTEMNQYGDDFPYAMNIQTHLTKDYYQVERTKPHLIVFHYDDEVNDIKALEKIIDVVHHLDDYEPYIILFGYGDDSVRARHRFGYNSLVAYKNTIHLETIANMAKSLDSKLELPDCSDKVYLNTSSEESFITIKHQVKILSMTESIIYVESKQNIPMWTVFKMYFPAKMLVTVVPHREGGPFSKEKNVYRCLINCVGEKERAIIRQEINKSLE